MTTSTATEWIPDTPPMDPPADTRWEGTGAPQKAREHGQGATSHIAGFASVQRVRGFVKTLNPEPTKTGDPFLDIANRQQYAAKTLDLMAAGVMILGALFLFIGLWVWLGIGVAFTTLGVVLLAVGFWTSVDNHREPKTSKTSNDQ